MSKDAFQRYLDAGIAFTAMTRAKAEELVNELVNSGELQGGDARAKVDELLERTRKSREAFVSQVRHEVTSQLEAVGVTNIEDLAKQVANLIGRAGEAARPGKKTAAKKKAPAKKAPASPKKAAAKKAAAKKAAPAKKTAAKKTPGKKTT